MGNMKRLTAMIVVTMILVCAASLCISSTVYSQGKNKDREKEQSAIYTTVLQILPDRFVKEE